MYTPNNHVFRLHWPISNPKRRHWEAVSPIQKALGLILFQTKKLKKKKKLFHAAVLPNKPFKMWARRWPLLEERAFFCWTKSFQLMYILKMRDILFFLLFLCCLFFLSFDVWAAKYFTLSRIEVVLCWVGVEEVHLQNDRNWPFWVQMKAVSCVIYEVESILKHGN